MHADAVAESVLPATRPLVPPPGHEPVIPVVVGTRPEAIKLVPIILALRASRTHRPLVVSTGQHHEMVREIFELAGIEADATLYAGDRHAHLNERVATVMRRFEDFVCEAFGDPPAAEPERLAAGMRGDFPIAVAVHGDTSSAMAAALAAFHMRIPVIHVEAGLRTGGLNLTPFPEELNRQVITCVAALHLAPTATNLENLVRENVPADQIFVTGNSGIDALRWASKLDVPFTDAQVQALVDGPDRIIVVTAHRRENWGPGLDGIAAGVAQLAGDHGDVRFVVPMHPNPSVREQLIQGLSRHANVLLTEPLGYAEFARLLDRSYFVITDSGGIQEEAPSLGKPVLVTRDSTERAEGIAAGTLILVGTKPERIVYEANRLLTDERAYASMAAAPNPYGDGRTAERIIDALAHIAGRGDPPESFGHGYTRRAILRAAGVNVPLAPVEQIKHDQSQHPEGPSGAELWPP